MKKRLWCNNLFPDINECDDTATCHANATCSNTDGSFGCACKTGYTGDGITCNGEMVELYLPPCCMQDFSNDLWYVKIDCSMMQHHTHNENLLLWINASVNDFLNATYLKLKKICFI